MLFFRSAVCLTLCLLFLSPGIVQANGQDAPKDKCREGQVREAVERVQKTIAVFQNMSHKELQKAAEEGNTHAQLLLGLMYLKEFGAPKDKSDPLEWIQKAADNGNVEAVLVLSYMYETGDGVPRDEGKALEWIQKAADQGNIIAQHSLSRRGISGDAPKAKEKRKTVGQVKKTAK